MSNLIDNKLPGIIDKMEKEYLEARPWDAVLIRQVMNEFRCAIVDIQNRGDNKHEHYLRKNNFKS